MDANLTADFIPSATLLAAAAGSVVVAIGALLLQKAARLHMQQHRCEELRKRVRRVDAQWSEAAM